MTIAQRAAQILAVDVARLRRAERAAEESTARVEVALTLLRTRVAQHLQMR